MTALASHKLQEAVYEILATSQTLGLKVTGVFDQPTKEARFPYVAMSETSASASSLKDRLGTSITFAVTVWSDEQSQMEVKELMADVDTVLNDQTPDLVGLDSLNLRLLNANIVRQFNDQGALYRGQLVYMAQLYEQA